MELNESYTVSIENVNFCVELSRELRTLRTIGSVERVIFYKVSDCSSVVIVASLFIFDENALKTAIAATSEAAGESIGVSSKCKKDSAGISLSTKTSHILPLNAPVISGEQNVSTDAPVT